MKTAVKSLFILLMLFQAALLHANDLRVVVCLFNSKDSDKDLARRMTIVCSEEVMRSRGFRYISPTELTKAATGDEKLVVDKAVDLEKEYSAGNAEYLQGVSNSHKNGFDTFFKALESTDIIIGGVVQRDGLLIKVELVMNRAEGERQYTVTIECAEGSLDAKMRKTMKDLLKKISRPVKIYADKLIDAKGSRVIYVVRAMDNTDMTIEMDYTGDRPDPQIQNVNILPPDGINKDGMTKYQVKSGEGRMIDIEFSLKQGKLNFVRVDTPIPDPSKMTSQSEILTMKSRAGYVLKFEFTWDKGEMQNAKLYPALNPFGDHEG